MIWIRWPRKNKKKNDSINYSDQWPDYYRSHYPNFNRKPVKRKSRRRIFFRTGVTVLLLVVLLVVRETQLPAGRQIRDHVRYLLTAEWNFEPLLQGAVRVASQIVNWDNPMFNSWPNTGPARPVMVSEGLWMPVSGKVVRDFGWSRDPLDGLERFHPGVDIEAEPGTPVRAVMDGQVVKVGADTSLGEYILLNHGEGNYTMYAGLQNILLQEGQWVSAGQKMAEVGEHSDLPRGGLHFEMRENNELINPLERLHMDN